MLSQVVINQGNFALQNRAENVVQTVVHCFSITSTNKLKINKITPLSQSPLGSRGILLELPKFVPYERNCHQKYREQLFSPYRRRTGSLVQNKKEISV